MVKFFWYKHPKTGKMLSDQRLIGYEEKSLVIRGVKCELVRYYVPPAREREGYNFAIINKNREVFQADSDFVKKCKPKYIKFQDGHKEIYDPTKHC